MKERGVVLEKKRMLEEDEEYGEEGFSSSNLVGIRKKRLRTPSLSEPTLTACEKRLCTQSSDLGISTMTQDAAVNALAPRFLENIAISSKGSYLFITEIEVYLRASPTIDDCANNTVTVGYPTVPLFTYYGKFEFLVTGCAHGKVDNDDVRAVLGASLGKPGLNDEYWRLYVPPTISQHVQDVRLLRNFTKAANGYKWRIKAKRFYHRRRFTSTSAINIHGDHFAAAGSLLIRMRVEQTDERELLVELIEQTSVLEKVDFRKPQARKNADAIKLLGLTQGKILVDDISLRVLRGFLVGDDMYLDLYKSLAAPRMKTLNTMAVNEKRYQS
ncbi:hypothetical protein MBANPS3_012286 [Mucor bainieri]